MNDPLNSFDELDDLQMRGFQLWQNSRFFRFGTDGVLLADFAKCKPGLKVLDLCSGTGIVPFLLLAKGDAERVVALELQPYLCRLMERSCRENQCEDRLEIIEGDLRKIRGLCKGSCYDLVTVNPPYEPVGRGIPGQNPYRELARREEACTLQDVIQAAAYLVKPGGRLAMVHRPYRLSAVLAEMVQGGFSPSRLRLAEPKSGEPANLIFVEGVRSGKRELVIEPTLILHNADGSETEELKSIYRRERKE